MWNRKNSGLDHRGFLSVAVYCFASFYTIGCGGDKGGNSSVNGGQQEAGILASDDSRLIAEDPNNSAGSNSTAETAGETAGQGGRRSGSSATSSVGGVAASAGGAGTGGTGGIGIEVTGGNGEHDSPTITSVSAGGVYVCVLRTDDSVVCWGSNDNGQAEIPSGSYTQISTIDELTCALKRDKSIVCRGAGDKGQAAPPSGSFIQVAAGNDASYAIRQDGSIACWGDCSDLNSPPSVGSYVQINARSLLPTCAVRDDGGITCWGTDDVALGNTAPDGCYTEVAGNCAITCDGSVACWGCTYTGPRVTSGSPLTHALSCGPLSGPNGSFTHISYDGGWTGKHCGITSDGSISCWKRARIIMDNTDIPGDIIPLPTPTGSYTQVSTGYVYACALKSDASMTCWSWMNEDSDPSIVPILIPSGPYTQISNYCALKSDGQIVCWNSPFSGLLGYFLFQAVAPSGPYEQVGGFCGLKSDGTIACWKWQLESYTLVERSAPTGSYTQLSAANFGSDFNCALTDGGAITCWDWGGTDLFGSENIRVRATPSGSYAQVNDSCALKDDGTIICWEWNLDDAGVVDPDAFTPIDVAPGSYTQVIYVDGHGCAIKNDGSVTCWGKDDFNQGTSPSGSYTQISAANYYNCGIKSSGTLARWGARGYPPVDKAVPFGLFTHVSCGSPESGTACAVRNDGSVACWGYDPVFFPASL